MREGIGLYRGKRKDNGEWVEGDLINLHDGRKFIINNKFGACIDDKGNFINTEAPFVCEVDPETVGEYTGLSDIKTKKIFEGDIVETGSERFVVIFDEYCRYMISDKKYNYLLARNNDELEIIGNIHDKLEMLHNT